MTRFAKLLLLIFLAVFISCAQLTKKPVSVQQPIVRVGLVEGADRVEFEPRGRLRIFERDGRRYSSDETGTWTAELRDVSEPEPDYRIVLFETGERESADRFQSSLSFGGQTERQQIGDALVVGTKKIAGEERYRILLKKSLPTEQEARSEAARLGIGDYQIINIQSKAPAGTVRITAPSGGYVDMKNVIRLTGSPIEIKNIAVGSGFHFARKEDRLYAGEIEIRIDNSGKLSVINVLTLENYIQGILPGEMTSAFPLEALKAQAICARTFFLYQFGRSHRGDPFDVCDDVHCQAFVGITKVDARIRKAVDETRGFVLMHNGNLCTTPYSGVCGGHTENAENVWIGDGESYLQGVYDIDSEGLPLASFDLSDENNLVKWVKSRPSVFCNAELNGDPGFAGYSKKYFRWRYSATRSQLESVIKEKTGEDIGTLLDLVPLERGNSGRIIRLSIVGTKKSITVGKELRIRQTLSPTTLFSASFTIEKLPPGNQVPTDFVFHGAGWGHGVGMCQIGAGVMAEKGYPAEKILSHYYRGTKILQYY